MTDFTRVDWQMLDAARKKMRVVIRQLEEGKRPHDDILHPRLQAEPIPRRGVARCVGCGRGTRPRLSPDSMTLTRSRRKPRSRPTEEQVIVNRQAECWLAQFSDRPCFGPMQLCHLIDKQRLRQRGVPESLIWDPRVLVDGCERHHSSVPKSAIPRSALPPGVEEYAAELSEFRLEGSLDRDYGPRPERIS